MIKLAKRPQIRTGNLFENMEFSIRKLILLLLGVIFFIALPRQIVRADPPGPNIPPGFRQILQEKGVALYRKDYPQGNPDLVQIVNFAEGAGIELLHGEISEFERAKGFMAGTTPDLNLTR